MKFNDLKNKFFIIAGPNVIESEEHTLMMAQKLKEIFKNYDVNFIFKVSFDKANRSSINSYRGLGFEEGLKILKKVKEQINVPIITDIHESWQARYVGKIVDIIQIPAFLCRQTDLLKASAETGKIIQIKKGQGFSSDVMHKSKEKVIAFGNPNVILCERGSTFGYHDLIVDPRNLIWLKSDTNLVSMDITHCLQQPAQKMSDGTIKAGGLRNFIPHMGKMAMAMDVNGIFMEVHDKPDDSKCDAPTQWYLDKMDWLLNELNIPKILTSKETCILCNKQLSDITLIYEKNIRGDINNTCKIIKCNLCTHKQLIGFKDNLKKHYDEDNQSNNIIKTFNLSLKNIIEKEKIEIQRRIKYLNLDKSTNYNLLDIGSGYCTFASELSNFDNINITCLEPSKKRINFGKEINNLDKSNINLLNKYLDEDFVNVNENKFDIVTSWHVLEHLEETVIDKVLINMIKCCKPNGLVIFEIPNGNDELLRIDKYKKINYMIHHLSYWTDNTLEFLLQKNNIKKYDILFVQRYGFNNYLNWIYNLNQIQDMDMNDDNKNTEWLNSKIKSKNTDAILVKIIK